jgi:hypothetical protein
VDGGQPRIVISIASAGTPKAIDNPIFASAIVSPRVGPPFVGADVTLSLGSGMTSHVSAAGSMPNERLNRPETSPGE